MQLIKHLLSALFLMTLVACGGGGTLETGGSGSGDLAKVPVYTITLKITDASGNDSTELSQATPLTVHAQLAATNGGIIANQVITFALSTEELALFGNSAGTALTDTNGVAKINLLVGNKSGAATLIAQFGEVSANASFYSKGDGGEQVSVTVGSISLIADSLQLGNGAGEKVELTALVRDVNNVVISDIPVLFSSDSGELEQVDALTLANGVAKAVLTTQTNKSMRDISVVAKVQQQESELIVKVVGTEFKIVGENLISIGETASFDVFLTDSNSQGLSGVAVNVSSLLGNTLSSTSPETTGSSGKATFTYTAVNPGKDELTLTALGATSVFKVSVSADKFVFVKEENEPQVIEVALNTAKALDVEWVANGVAKSAEAVNFTTNRGVVADTAANASTTSNVTTNITTDAQGKAKVFVLSGFAGVAAITATAGSGENAVSAQKVIEFVADTPSKLTVQAFPTQLAVGETSTISTIVRDINNNPVKNQKVIFSLNDAAGGSISPSVATTNSDGLATTTFTASSITGAGLQSNNLLLKAMLQNNNSIQDETGLTVSDKMLFFRLGTGKDISLMSSSLYSKEYSVIVTDSTGNPVANQLLNLAVVPVQYSKGDWSKLLNSGTFKEWVPNVAVTCPNEDQNYNGILDAGEDTNGDGMLTPGNMASVPKTVSSDANGIATFVVTYLKNAAPWLDVRLQVSGAVDGTENMVHTTFTLPYAQADVTNEDISPVKPAFGVTALCTNTN